MVKVIVRNNVGFMVDGELKAKLEFNVPDDTLVGDFMTENAATLNTGKTPMLNGVTIDDEIMEQAFSEFAGDKNIVYLSYTKNSEGN